MHLEINTHSDESVVNSFRDISKTLFTNYKLIVNEKQYRFIDLEFYYYAEGVFEDIFAHKHVHQLQNGKWYAHGSGMDITFGNDKNYGGILIRALAEVDKDSPKEKYFIKSEIHGPLNVKTEIFSNLNSAFDENSNRFYLQNISKDKHGALMIEPKHIIETNRIGLNPTNDLSEASKFYNGKFRFVVFPHLKLKNKTLIAKDMQNQFPDLTKEEINRFFGSKFL